MPITESAERVDLAVTDVTGLSWEDLAAEMYDGPTYTSPCVNGCGTSNGNVCNGFTFNSANCCTVYPQSEE
jgi:hypothetical protein